ncbi:hypothetical protein GW17_00028247 [Ensete ventricosum]|nr:hypothetical protein GW17_00028247 [Ensete ventricosum]
MRGIVAIIRGHFARRNCCYRVQPPPTSPSPYVVVCACHLATPKCYLCSGDDLELSGVVLKLPVFIPLSKGASIVRCHCRRFLLADTGELHL